MSRQNTPLPIDGPDRPFAEPWHAEVFALTVSLSQAGHFTWPEWADCFGAGLQKAAASGGPEDGSDYWDVWLVSLETILATREVAGQDELSVLRDAWEKAYLSTPHGAPVSLPTR